MGLITYRSKESKLAPQRAIGSEDFEAVRVSVARVLLELPGICSYYAHRAAADPAEPHEHADSCSTWKAPASVGTLRD